MKIVYDWNPSKAASNQLKHGVSFETATRVFLDSHFISEIESFVDGEERWQTIGLVDGVLMLTVVHTTYDEIDTEYIRIISARRATPHERAKYERENRSLRH